MGLNKAARVAATTANPAPECPDVSWRYWPPRRGGREFDPFWRCPAGNEMNPPAAEADCGRFFRALRTAALLDTMLLINM